MSETPLQRAQRIAREFEPRRLEIVDALRGQGWDREDAVEESFARLNQRIAAAEGHANHGE